MQSNAQCMPMFKYFYVWRERIFGALTPVAGMTGSSIDVR